MGIIKKVSILTTISFFIICNSLFAANKVFEYGFEDWGGSISSTPNYPFSSAYQGYVDEHESGSEVVGSYDGLSPHSGSYFWLLNHGSGSLSPSVPGITSPAINPHNNLGLLAEYGGKNPWLVSSISTNECFIRFWMASDGWENTITNGKFKVVRFHETGSDVMFMIHEDKRFSLFAEDSMHYGAIFSNIDDRNWHKFGVYVNYNTGRVALWYDVGGLETWANATIKWTDPDGRISGGPTPSPIVLVSNWSAYNPNGEVWHALDDIEVWDGLPSASSAGNDDPVGPPSDVTNFAATPGDGSVQLSWTNPTDADFNGTMVRYRTDGTYPSNHSDGTLVCNRTASSGSNDSYAATGLSNGTTYYFSAFTYDNVYNYSETAHVVATPMSDSAKAVPLNLHF